MLDVTLRGCPTAMSAHCPASDTCVGEDDFVSIIMPVRNEAGHIARAVESIRVQDLDAAFEVIVVDGRSTDGTRETIESWCRSDARVRLLDNLGGAAVELESDRMLHSPAVTHLRYRIVK